MTPVSAMSAFETDNRERGRRIADGCAVAIVAFSWFVVIFALIVSIDWSWPLYFVIPLAALLTEPLVVRHVHRRNTRRNARTVLEPVEQLTRRQR